MSVITLFPNKATFGGTGGSDIRILGEDSSAHNNIEH
jgi:hypothetical protein